MAVTFLRQRVLSNQQICCTWRFVCRQLCAVAVQQQHKETRQTGVPLIVPKHVIAKAFIVHPSTTSVFEASSKYQWLTKTKLFEGLPAPFSNVENFLDDKEYEHLREKFKESILQNHAFRKEGISASHRFRRRGEEMTMGFLQDLLRFGWSLSDRHRHLDDCFLDLKPKMRIHWARHHNFYQLDQEPAFVIRTKQPSQLLEPSKWNNLTLWLEHWQYKSTQLL